MTAVVTNILFLLIGCCTSCDFLSARRYLRELSILDPSTLELKDDKTQEQGKVEDHVNVAFSGDKHQSFRNLFIIGDSVSYFVVKAAMETKECISTHPNGWCSDAFRLYPTEDCLACSSTSGATIGFIRTFGSAANGPYRFDACQYYHESRERVPADKQANCFTTQRICKSLQQHTELVGPPTDVVSFLTYRLISR